MTKCDIVINLCGLFQSSDNTFGSEVLFSYPLKKWGENLTIPSVTVHMRKYYELGRASFPNNEN